MLGYAAAELVNSNMEIYLMMFRVAAECVEHQCCMVHRASAWHTELRDRGLSASRTKSPRGVGEI